MIGTGPLRFLAIIGTVIALIPAGAHLFALSKKIGLPQDSISLCSRSTSAGHGSARYFLRRFILDFALVIGTRGSAAMIAPLIALVAALAALVIFFA